MPNLNEALPLPEIYYAHDKGVYYQQDAGGRWIKLNEKSILRHLRINGYSRKCDETGLSEAESTLTAIQLHQNVDYAGGLAGHRSGYREFNGFPILVTEEARRIVPREGGFPILSQLFERMFVDGNIDQRPYLYGWLKSALRWYGPDSPGGDTAGVFKGGQVLALAGPVCSGKSLLQGLITEIFGGRSADAYLYISGRTQFNSEMFRAEHLTLEDKAESTRIEPRRELGAKIKEIAANQRQHCHGKNKDGLQLDPIWRMTISLNDDPERMMILPPLDSDIEDKIMLLKVYHREMPMPCSTETERQLFRETLSQELPAFAHFLNQWQVPVDIRADRFGIVAYHHPELRAMLDSTTPEQELLELIDRELWRGHEGGPMAMNSEAKAREYTSSELETYLKRESSSVRREADRLIKGRIQCGAYLGRLRTKDGSRISDRMVNGTKVWTIQPPAHLQPHGPAQPEVPSDGSDTTPPTPPVLPPAVVVVEE